MEQGYIENGFIVDVSNARKTSEIIYQLSTILDLPDAHCKKVCLKLGNTDLSQSELISIKALVESLNSEIEFVTTFSQCTAESAAEIGLKVSELENKVSAPVFNQDKDETLKNDTELEKALDKIFGESGLDEQTFHADKEMKKLQKNQSENNNISVIENIPELSEFKNADEIKEESPGEEEITETQITEDISSVGEPEICESDIFSEGCVSVPVEEKIANEAVDRKDFNEELEQINREVTDVYNRDEEVDFIQLQKCLRETEKLPTLYIQRTLRSGQSITAEGNIVVIGDVNPGSEIKATGDITVWGVLGGIAHAGAYGNKYARIRALKMNAIQLRIADVFARRPDSINIPYIQKSDTFVPEEATVKHKQIIINKLYEN